MPTTVERPPVANVVAHATEYPADRDADGRGDDRKRSNESEAERHDEDTGSSAETPAVLVDANHHEDHSLDGVAAYRAAARHALEPHLETPKRNRMQISADKQAAETVRHAYEDHGGEIEHHEVNVAT
jgi:hypothetical protein